ncbi:hypothetical protein B0H13DRAFT_1038270 [Mycena leptocephala]|nr:hypothetical protein B0H13DRAFT_1038270 [Mycena leptocephala]
MSNHDKGKKPQRETIELEDDEARLERIQRVLEKLNTVSPTAGRGMESILNAAGASEPGPRSEGSLNELLTRVQAFLPEIQASNATLLQKASLDPHSVDIENVEGDEKVIQMNLGLGLFEDRSGMEGSESEPETDKNSDIDVEEEDAMEEDSDESSSDTDGSDESSSEDESSEAESDDSGGADQRRSFAPLPKRALLAREIKPLARRGRPEIVVLAETTTND